jgi:hypothetical protein
VRAAGAAGLGAGTESLINDVLDGAGASATFGAAAEATINLLGITRKIFSGPDGVADIVVAEDVAGTNNHKGGGLICDAEASRYLRPQRDAKEKPLFSSDSKMMPDADWNESKKFWCGRSKCGRLSVLYDVQR